MLSKFYKFENNEPEPVTANIYASGIQIDVFNNELV